MSDVYTGLADEPAEIVPTPIAELRDIVLWLSKQPWPQPEDQTWDGLVRSHERSLHPEKLPELPNRGFRVGK